MTTEKTIGEDTNNVHVYDVNADGKTYRVLAVDAYTAERKGKLLYQLECKKSPRDVAARMVARVKQIETSPAPLADLWKDEREDDMPERAELSNPDAEALAVALEAIDAELTEYNDGECICDHSVGLCYCAYNSIREQMSSALAAYRAKHSKDTR